MSSETITRYDLERILNKVPVSPATGYVKEDANGDISITRNITAGGDITDGNGISLADLYEVQTTYGVAYNITSNLSLTTSVQKIPLKTFYGNGCSLSSNGIKVPKSGVYRIDGSTYLATNFTVNDIVHLAITVNNNTIQLEALTRITVANPYTVLLSGTYITQLNANDVVYLYAYNQSGARGVISNRDEDRLSVKRLT